MCIAVAVGGAGRWALDWPASEPRPRAPVSIETLIFPGTVNKAWNTDRPSPRPCSAPLGAALREGRLERYSYPALAPTGHPSPAEQTEMRCNMKFSTITSYVNLTPLSAGSRKFCVFVEFVEIMKRITNRCVSYLHPCGYHYVHLQQVRNSSHINL